MSRVNKRLPLSPPLPNFNTYLNKPLRFEIKKNVVLNIKSKKIRQSLFYTPIVRQVFVITTAF